MMLVCLMNSVMVSMVSAIVCARCKNCGNGIDGTCGHCGDNFPVESPGSSCEPSSILF